MPLRDQLQQTLGSAYKLERELGGGGMSRVFLAEETALGRKVVVKVLPPELTAGVNVERFKREIQVAARLQHPHIVPVLTAGETGGVPFYSMPFVEGESLRARLARAGGAPVPMTDVIAILRDVAKALDYAHAHGIVHRDIKPDNVLLSGRSATVTDFGIAKAIAAARTGDGDRQPTLTQIGSSIGTPAYMAPEQAAGDPATNHRADLYAFGCMGYELLAGRPPFAASTPQRLLAAHMADTPEPVKLLRPDTPDTLADTVMRCLQKDADLRPQNAGDLVQVLETVTSGGGHAAMPEVLLGGRGMITKALGAYVTAFVFVAVLAKAAIVGIGLPDWVFPGALVVMGLGLPVILFTAYVHRTTRRIMTQTPTYTPGGSPSTTHGTIATIALKASPHVSWRRTWMGGVFAVGTFVVLIAAYMILRALGIGPFGSLFAAGTLQKNERLLVADFNISANDSSMGPVITDAFRTALGQSRSITVMQPTDLRDVLRRMQKPANTKVDFAVAREVATREGIRAVVLGDVASLGGNYAVSIRLVSPQTGDELANFRETAEGAKQLLPAIDKIAKDLRARTGESLRSVQAARPLERVTTPSLEALKKYVQATRLLDVTGDFPKAAALLEEAIALDTGFAMAYRRLAIEYNNRQQFDRAMALLVKSYEHRDRLSDAERYLVTGGYYQSGPRQDIAKAIAAYESLLDLQPRFATALNNLGVLSSWTRQHVKAEDLYRRSIATGIAPAVSYTNLASTLWYQGRHDEAWRAMAVADSAFPGNAGAREWRARMLSADGRYDSAAALMQLHIKERPNDQPGRALAANILGSIARVHGRLRESAKWDDELHAANVQRGLPQAALLRATSDVRNQIWFFDNRSAVASLDRALAEHPLEKVPVPTRPYDIVAISFATAGRGDRIRGLIASFEQAHEKIIQIFDDGTRHFLQGLLAFTEKRYDDAVRELREAYTPGCITCPLPFIAQSYDLTGKSDSAIAVFEEYLKTADVVRVFRDGYYLAGTHKRLGELYEAKGDRQNALTHYLAFVDLWKNADPELQPRVNEVRRRIVRLQATESR
jgi:tetratricopeptide (TPR) repeat protein/tRNA A-37 threonylcarbamoyl transferase component Bud32